MFIKLVILKKYSLTVRKFIFKKQKEFLDKNQFAKSTL